MAFMAFLKTTITIRESILKKDANSLVSRITFVGIFFPHFSLLRHTTCSLMEVFVSSYLTEAADIDFRFENFQICFTFRFFA